MGKRTFRIRKRMGLTNEHEEAMQEVDELEEMIKSQIDTAKQWKPKYTAKRKKLESTRDAAEVRLRKADSANVRDELENKVEKLDRRVSKASARVKSLDRRISKAAAALDDLDILRLDIELANDMEHIDYLEKVQSMKAKVTQDAMDEEMPGATFDAVCDEISSLAEETGEQHHSVFDDELLEDHDIGAESETTETKEGLTEASSDTSV